ncbi:MAG: alpha/beta hydrolase [Anaerolineae bacterium]
MSSPRASRRYWLRLAAFTAVVSGLAAVGVVAALAVKQYDVFVTPRRQPITQTPANVKLPYQDITLTSADGLKLAGWFIPGSRPEAIILVHGINANRQVMLPTAAILAEAGYPLLLVDLRGHGQSDPSHVTYGYREALDVQAAADFLARQPGIEQIGALGLSLGGATVIRAAAIEPRIGPLVVQGTFSSLPGAIDDAFEGMSIFPRWPFAPLFVAVAERQLGLNAEMVDSRRDLAVMAPRPLLIIHGRQDHLFPVYHAEEMYRAAPQPKWLWIIEDMGHGDPAQSHTDEYRARVLTFFAGAFGQRGN